MPSFREQNRFVDPSLALPPEWTAPTPPHGFPVVQGGPSAADLPPQTSPVPLPAPYLDLSTVALLGRPKQAPSKGWRRWVYLGSFKLLNVGESPKVTNQMTLLDEVGRPLRGCYRIAVLSLKGGVGAVHSAGSGLAGSPSKLLKRFCSRKLGTAQTPA